ncbi:YfhO family protein [Candidatus Gottesmanbacteria bacterium]|nr:YfhO family protein [Candidatus Gottesmanbacteria bacterium]
MKRIFYPIILVGVVLVFFWRFFLQGLLPIPADTIVGMYHPWRDKVWDSFTAGVPFKNFLITDPVRQQYVWRHLVIEQLKHDQLPIWNPYSFSGTPLLANHQSAPFYPLNILFFILPFNVAWVILIILQPLLAGLFLYVYLKNLKISQFGSLLGALTFAFSGFSIAWLEWNTILHVGLWLPLILLSIDKICISYINISYKQSFSLNKKSVIWSAVLLFSLISSFFAGHLQTFFYVFVFATVYLFIRWWRSGKSIRIIPLFAICYLLFAILTSIQWVPTLQFVNLSARGQDLPNWSQPGWFIPWQNLIQFLAPDFFGNPATLNYWGEWNYGEFVGYIGILPLILSLLAMLWRRDTKVLFFGGVAFVSLMFALPTPLARLPYQWQVPFLSTSQPTRLLFITDFSLAVLAALGFDWFMRCLNDSNQLSKIIRVILLCGLVFGGLWVFSLLAQSQTGIVTIENLTIARRNLVLPTVLFISSMVILLGAYFIRKTREFTTVIYIIVVGVVIFDLFRFGWKFIPFTSQEWLFPKTETIDFLKSQQRPFRFMTTDRRIFPPNFATFYRLEDIAGYDPLYLKTYGELVAAWERGKPEISPVSFNRILTPHDYSLRIADLLNVKYVLSLKDESSPKLKLVFQEGQTRVYENKNAYPRALLVYDYKIAKNRQEAINFLFDESVNLRKTAILEERLDIELAGEDKEGKAEIVSYETQKIVIKTQSQKIAILVLADSFYPGWQAFLDGKQESEKTFRVDFTLRGIFVPEGEHQIEFKMMLP